MKKYLGVAALAVTLTFSACSDSTTDVGTSQPQVQLVSDFSDSDVSMMFLKSSGDAAFAEGDRVDSLKITRIKTLISRVKFHRDKEDTTGERDFKTTPIILVAGADTTYTIATQPMPTGTYDKIKFEFHKLSGSEINTYLNDTNYRDFVQNDRPTFVIEGVLFKNGVAENFTYRSDANANLSLKLEPSITIKENTVTTIIMRYEPRVIFKMDNIGAVLDPRDPKNESHIDNMIKSAIRAIKK